MSCEVMNIADYVTTFAKRNPSKAALRWYGETWTYGDLDTASYRLSARLAELGLVGGDRVALMFGNDPLFVVAYLACMRAGYIVVPINTKLADDEIGWILEDCTPKALLYSAKLKSKCANLSGATPATMGLTELDVWAGCEQGSSEPPKRVRADQLSTILYTSGTTGRPKGVTLSHGNVLFNMRSKVKYLKIDDNDVLLLFLPLYHCFGLNAVLNAGLCGGATVVLREKYERSVLHSVCPNEGVTLFFAVPHMYRLILVSGINPEWIGSVRLFLSAGDKLDLDLQRRWSREFGLPISEAYGLTESSPFATFNNQEREKVGSVGAAIEEVDIGIRKPDTGEIVASEAVGEIVIRGPNIMQGYWGTPSATKETIRDGWLLTGDLGWIDEDGYLYVVGRLKDLIIVGGQNVYPAEVERVIKEHEDVEDVVVYSKRHKLAGEIVCADIVAKDGIELGGDIRIWCKGRLAEFKIPTFVQIVDSIPITATGKKVRNGR